MKSKYYGIIFIIISALFFALMNLFVAAAGELPTMQKAFFRNVVAAAIALVMLLRKPSQFKTIKGNVLSITIRAIAGTLGVVLNFYAIDRMNISDASVLNKLSPFFGIVFSFIILKEKPKWLEWIAVIVAFGGAVFVARPTFAADGAVNVWPAISGVCGGMMAGLAYTFVRKASMGGAARNLIIFAFSAFSCIVLLPFMIIWFKPMSWLQTLYLLLSGAAAAGGQIFITMAYARAPAKEISVFDYSIVLFTAALGAIFLKQYPDWQSYVGYAIIIASAVAVWVYHMYRDKHVKLAKTEEPIKETNIETEIAPTAAEPQNTEENKEADKQTEKGNNNG